MWRNATALRVNRMSNLPVNTESNAPENKLNNVSSDTHAPKKLEKLVAVKGMNDIAPPVSAHWEWLEDKVRCQWQEHAIC